MHDHDQRFKTLIQEFFAEFLQLFFAAWAERFDFSPLSEQKRFLLGECVEAYLPLDEVQRREFESLLFTEKYVGVQAMNKTTYEKGIEKSIEKGIEKSEEKWRRAMLREQLEARFAPLPASVDERLQQLSVIELTKLGKAVLRAQSLRELGFDEPATA